MKKQAQEIEEAPPGQGGTPAMAEGAGAGAGAGAVPAQNTPTGGSGTAAGGWVRLEEVIKYLQNVDKNKGGHDVKITATSDTAGSHKFEITVKEKPMMNKANGMGQVAAGSNVEIKVAMQSETKPVELFKVVKKPEDSTKNLKETYPNGFLTAMGLV